MLSLIHILNSTDWRHEVQKSGWVNNELQNYANGSADGKRVTEIAYNRLYTVSYTHLQQPIQT